MLQLYVQKTGLNRIQAPVVALDVVIVLLCLAVIADHSNLRGDCRTTILCTHNLPEAEMLADRIAVIRRGRLVALGTPAELKVELLGTPLWEVRLAEPLKTQWPLDDHAIQVVSMDSLSAQFRTERPTVTNPQLLRRLQGSGGEVVSLNEVPRSLEQVYLKLIEEDQAGAGVLDEHGGRAGLDSALAHDAFDHELEHRRQHHPAPVLGRDEAAVLAHPADPRPLRPGLLHRRRHVAGREGAGLRVEGGELGAQRLHAYFPAPKLRVVVSQEVSPFIAKGGNVFARHVMSVDPEMRAGEEVLVVDENDRLVATGTAALSPEEMLQIKRGAAVLSRRSSGV